MITEFKLNEADGNLPGLDISAEDWHLGETPDIEFCDITLRLAELPLAMNYYQLCELKSEKLSPELELLYKRYDLWVIKHTVSIMDRSKSCNVLEFGFQCSFDKAYPMQIREMLPETKFIKPTVTGGFRFTAKVGAAGEATVPETNISLQVADTTVSGNLGISASADMGLNLSFPVLSPLITAVGQNSRFGEWLIKKDQEPLVGDQILTHIVITEKGLPDLKFRAKTYVTVRRFGVFNSRRESNWIDLNCELI